MDVQTAIRTRRDLTAFAPECPPREAIARLIDAAVWAPNHHRVEPWRFHVLAGEGRDAMADALARWLATQGRGEAPQQATRSKILRAPVLLIVSQAGDGEGDPGRALEDYAACMCAVQNILLTAHAEGLIAHFSTDHTLMGDGAREYLGLTASDRIVACLHLGYLREGVDVPEGVRREPVVRWDWGASEA